MKTILVPTNGLAKVIDMPNTLEDIHRTINCSCMTCCYPFSEPIALVIDDNGKISGEKSPNRNIIDNDGNVSDVIFGDFLVVGLEADDFGDIPEYLIQPLLWHYNVTNVIPDVDLAMEILNRPMMRYIPMTEEDFARWLGISEDEKE